MSCYAHREDPSLAKIFAETSSRSRTVPAFQRIFFWHYKAAVGLRRYAPRSRILDLPVDEMHWKKAARFAE